MWGIGAVRSGWYVSRGTTFGSPVGNMCILKGQGKAGRRATLSGTRSIYVRVFEPFEVLLGLFKGGQTNIHHGWYVCSVSETFQLSIDFLSIVRRYWIHKFPKEFTKQTDGF